MKKAPLIIILIILVQLILSCQSVKEIQPGADSGIEAKIDSLLAIMTLEEKVGQMNQYSNYWGATGPVADNPDLEKRFEDIKNGRVGSMLNVFSVDAVKQAQDLVMEHSRLKIPLLFGLDVIHGYKTIFPIPLGEASSWDADLMKRTARVAAIEASAEGVNWTFAPMIDLSREPRWGRVMEAAGEDPYLNSVAAVARIEGFQGDDLSLHNTIAACAKHYIAYGAPVAGREYNTVDISGYSLYNDFMPPFKAAVDAGVASIMNGFNTLNGIPVTGHKHLVDNVLKSDWGFPGLIVSDWASIDEMQAHGFVENRKEAALRAIEARCDMDMESEAYIDYLVELVKDGSVSESYIDDAVRRILRLKFQLGLFDDPYRYIDSNRQDTLPLHPEHLKLAHEAALKSMVLLKNQNQALPLHPANIGSVALIGPYASDKDSPLGNWRAEGGNNNAISVEEGLRSRFGETVSIHVAEGCRFVNPDAEHQGEIWRTKPEISCSEAEFANALAVARKSDVIIAAMGESAMMSGEARSAGNIHLPGRQEELLTELNKLGKPIILLVFSGRPLILTQAHYSNNVKAIIQCWHLGTQSGYAVADILSGNYNPSGKLPITFPYHQGQIPIFYNQMMTGRPRINNDDIWVSRYSDIPNEPLYPFGHGLSYTTFGYNNLAVSNPTIEMHESLKVTVEVSNTGKYAGEETVQLYLRDMVASYTRPVKELKAFQKIFLEPGETKQVELIIDNGDLSFFDENGNKIIEPGEFKIFVGSSSENVQEAVFRLL